MILSIPDYSRDFVDFDLATVDEQDEDYEERKMMADGASVAEALLAAAQIFVYAALREVPPRARIFRVLLERLRVAIDRPNVCKLALWRKARNLNTLLWVLVVASSVATAPSERTWWISELIDVVADLGIASQAELEGFMTRVAWTDVFFGAAIEGVWTESCKSEENREGGRERVGACTIDPRLLGKACPPVEFEWCGSHI
jgi:hypothetical protein